jgi:hypothetical protein
LHSRSLSPTCLPLAACCFAAAAHNRLGSVYGRHAAPLPKAMNIFNALGSIAFAYNFTGGAIQCSMQLYW